MSSPLSLPAFTAGIEPRLIFEFDCLIAVTAALLAVSTVAVALRVYVRAKINRSFGWDDGTMVAAWVGFIVTSALCFVATKAEKALVQGVVTMSTPILVQVLCFVSPTINTSAYSVAVDSVYQRVIRFDHDPGQD